MIAIATRALTVACLILGSMPAFGQPLVQNGLLDLSDWDLVQDGVVELDGDWLFYWGEHLNSAQLALRPPGDESLMSVPSNWNTSTSFPAVGIATYRLEILLADLSPLALKFRTVGTAYRLFVDGKQLLEVGRAGQSLATSSPDYLSKIVGFIPGSKRVEIIIQVSNFHHRNAGLWETIKFGHPDDLTTLRQNRLSLDLILYGAIVMMALYNLITWATRTKNLSGLYLGLFCLVISARILLVDERYLNQVFPTLGWSLLTRFEYFTWMISIPIFLNFIRSMFPTEVSILALRTLWGLSALFCGLTLFLPIAMATELVVPYQIVTLLGMVYAAYCIGLAIFRRKEGSYLFGIGAALLTLAALSDIFTVMLTLDLENKLQIGLFLFVLLQSIQVSLRSSRAFQTVEAQSSELRKTNLELHIQQKLRRAAEGQSTELNQQVNQARRVAGYGIVANAVSDRLLHQVDASEPDDSVANVAVHTLNDVATLLRGDEPERKSIDLSEFIVDFFKSESYKSLRAEYPLVEIDYQLDAMQGEFKGAPLYLQFLIYHLIRYSMATQIHAQQVKITGKTDYVFAGSLFHHQVSDGNYYIVGIEDQGQGIHPEDLVEIFDPQLRTAGFKNLEKNSRDLAIAWTILEDHGGALDLHSLAESTRLELYFPCGNGQ